MKNLTQINKKIWERKKKYFERVDYYAQKIKEKAIEILGQSTRVFVFGSVAKGCWGPGSDIDILIVSDKLSQDWQENRWIRTKIKSKVDPFAPFQIHLARPEEFKEWYQKFIKDDYYEV